jgi:hypothetical protein
LTLDVLKQRGWEGPNWCVHCGEIEESVDHIFGHCSFAKWVWENVLLKLKYYGEWGGLDFESNLSN